MSNQDQTSQEVAQTHIVSIDIGIKNLAVCYMTLFLHEPEPILVVRHWEVHTLSDRGTERDLDLLGRTLFQSLDTAFEDLPPPDYFVIENQPALKNPTMKSVQMLTFSYAVAKKTWSNWTASLHFMSATEKLKGYNLSPDATADYRQRKKSAVAVTRDITAENAELQRTLSTAGKKLDDLCDCLLQGIAFLRKQKLLLCSPKDALRVGPRLNSHT